MGNVEQRYKKTAQMREFRGELMERFMPIYMEDKKKMFSVPKELCKTEIQNKFLSAKWNLINRRVQTMLQA